MRYFMIIEIAGLVGLNKFHDIISLNNKIIAADDNKLKIFEFE